MAEICAFRTAKEALDKGFAEGAEDSQRGFQSEDFARELREPFQWRRGPRSPFYEEWLRGYASGYRRQAKPMSVANK